ncbi:biotin transporter BioY [Bacillus litorisediminis]|uniref:biotin transporter BioY n=1 Tax=Bacillus litorisediminis TaxID=2922713 RepID=UPI001FABE405|nr:biotin transporter BioY [Bacillus litorisediminis]
MERNNKLRMLLYCALFAAITGILAQITIPLPLIPITGQTLAVGLTATILGSRYGAIAMIVYAAIGAVGVPVFTQASAGFHVLVGPTGGFIIGFIVTAYVTGLILEKTKFTISMAMIANLAGMIITLALGGIQYKFVADVSWTAAMSVAVTPFILGGIVKAYLASLVGIKVRERLVQARLLEGERRIERNKNIA